MGQLAKNLLAKVFKPTDLRSYVKSNEGKRLKCYDDKTGKTLLVGDAPEGIPTIGYGHTGPEVVPGLEWTDTQCEQAYNHDLVLAQTNGQRVFGSFRWGSLDEVRRAACTDLSFNLGRPRLLRFFHFIKAVAGSDWQLAHDELLLSEYAKELPARAGRNAKMILTGEWQ